MNVKIAYAVPFERVPSKVDDLLREAFRELEVVSHQADATDSKTIIEKLEIIREARKKLVSIDLLLDDCYTILASYNKALADMQLSTGADNGGVHDGGFSGSTTESPNGQTQQ